MLANSQYTLSVFKTGRTIIHSLVRKWAHGRPLKQQVEKKTGVQPTLLAHLLFIGLRKSCLGDMQTQRLKFKHKSVFWHDPALTWSTCGWLSEKCHGSDFIWQSDEWFQTDKSNYTYRLLFFLWISDRDSQGQLHQSHAVESSWQQINFYLKSTLDSKTSWNCAETEKKITVSQKE